MAWRWGQQEQQRPKAMVIRPPAKAWNASSGKGNSVDLGFNDPHLSKSGAPPPPSFGNSVAPSGSDANHEAKPTAAEPNPWSSMRRTSGRGQKVDGIAAATMSSGAEEVPLAAPEPEAKTLALVSTVMVGQVPESDCVEVEASAACRTVRMSNFPASWVTPTNEEALVPKIRNLLEKFGTLDGDIIVQRFPDNPPVATAPFEEEAAAIAAIQTLHGVDNRNQAEKKKAGHSSPQEFEKFYVQQASLPVAQCNGGFEGSPVSVIDEDEEEPSPAVPEVSAADLPKRIRISDVPAEWSLQDVQELCSQYGEVVNCVSEGNSDFLATFTSQEQAAAARENLQGFEVQTEVGQNTLACVQLGGVVSASEPTDLGPPPPPRALASEAYDPEDAVSNSKESEDPNLPYNIYVDELKLGMGEPTKQDKEIFLRDLPLEDYSEQQLREWLDSFGRIDHVEFLKEPLGDELSAKGYVTFPTHEEAKGLIAAFPVDDEEGNVQGTWSLSERVRRGADGALGADVIGAISNGLIAIKAQFGGCTALHLVGEGCDEVKLPFEAAPVKPSGPLRFAIWPRSLVAEEIVGLKSRLSALLDDTVPAPAPVTSSRGKSQTEVQETNGDDRRNDQMEDDADSSEEDEVDEAPADADEAALEETPSSPCIRVQGFPASWSEQQVRLVFALFGGVASVKFIGRASGRIAHVELKNPENMEKAVDQLHNTQVGDGDLIEECTVMCELLGQVALKSKGPVRHTLFIDDLPMPKRPDLPPGEQDREVFLQGLPVEDCTKDQIKSWLEGFGVVEDVHLLRDPYSAEPTGRGYVRFASHREARACVEAQASAVDAEEGDVVASWSESERAAQRTASVYGMDVNTAFAGSSGRVTASILVASKMKELCILSEHFPPKDKAAPQPEARQLHFHAFCSDDQFQELRNVISGALQGFHEKVNRRLRDPREVSNRENENRLKRPAEEARLAGPLDGMNVSPGTVPAPPPGMWGKGVPPPGEWPGAYPPPNSPPGNWHYDWHGRPPPPGAHPPQGKGSRDPYSQHSQHPPPPGPPGSHAPPPPGGWYPPSGPPGQFMPPPGYHAASPHPWVPPGSTPGYPPVGNAVPNKGAEAAVDEKPSGMAMVEDDKEAPFDPALQQHVERGERLVRDGKRAAVKGVTEKAYEKYCRGLQYLLDVMPKLGEDRPKAQELRQRINGYLDEAEKLKQKLDSTEAIAHAPPVPNTSQSTPHFEEENVELTAKSKSAGAPPVRPRNVAVKSAAATPPHTLSKASSPAAHEDQFVRDDKFLDSAMGKQVARGEALIQEGKQSEKVGKFDEAYEKYCRGLQHLLEVMPKLNTDSPQVVELRKKIGGYLEQAEKLKEKLETPPTTAIPGAKEKHSQGGHKSRLPAPGDGAMPSKEHRGHRRRRGSAGIDGEPPHRARDGGNDRLARSRSPPHRGLPQPHRRNRGGPHREGGEPSRSRSPRSGGHRAGSRGLPQPGGATLRPGPKASLREYRGDRGDRGGDRGRDIREVRDPPPMHGARPRRN